MPFAVTWLKFFCLCEVFTTKTNYCQRKFVVMQILNLPKAMIDLETGVHFSHDAKATESVCTKPNKLQVTDISTDAYLFE
jgi:hypothetical protein